MQQQHYFPSFGQAGVRCCVLTRGASSFVQQQQVTWARNTGHSVALGQSRTRLSLSLSLSLSCLCAASLSLSHAHRQKPATNITNKFLRPPRPPPPSGEGEGFTACLVYCCMVCSREARRGDSSSQGSYRFLQRQRLDSKMPPQTAQRVAQCGNRLISNLPAISRQRELGCQREVQASSLGPDHPKTSATSSRPQILRGVSRCRRTHAISR